MPLVEGDLHPEKFELLATIDRAERIDGHYVVEDGSLRLMADDFDVTGWQPAHLDELVARLHEVHAAGGIVVGTWDGPDLVALASLDVRPVADHPVTMTTTMKLDILHVSRPHRHRGIGRRLIELLAEQARLRGATSLYISATPTRNTVDAYLHVGAVLADPPDPHLLEFEPEDVHLILAL